jgi:hypothetical protein
MTAVQPTTADEIIHQPMNASPESPESVDELGCCGRECSADEPGCAQGWHIQEAEGCLQQLWWKQVKCAKPAETTTLSGTSIAGRHGKLDRTEKAKGEGDRDWFGNTAPR